MENSNIEWTINTFNIAIGCTKISPGCANCYAERKSKQWGDDLWGKTKPRQTMGKYYWAKPYEWNAQAQAEGVRVRVFCSSMCDVFEEHPTIDAERGKLWPLIRATPWLDWQILTKRAERIASNLPSDWGNGYPNVWLGVSVESDDYAWRFNDHLAKIPCAVRFVSYEPALGPLTNLDWVKLNWIIYGGESGPVFRQDDTAWAESVRKQCLEFGVSFFYKQTAARWPGTGATLNGQTIQEFPKPQTLQMAA